MSQEEWTGVVNDMVARGANGSADDLANVVTYLATNYGPKQAAPAAVSTAAGAMAAPALQGSNQQRPLMLIPEQAPLSSSELAKGRSLVQKKSCTTCHRVEGQGSYQGPNLNNLGATRTPEQIRASLVTPSPQVLPQNRKIRLVTSDGKIVSGKILDQDGFTIGLIDSSDHLVTYQKAGLRQFTIIESNPMPSYETMSAQDLNDLVRYLSSLREPSRP
ncbi:MAG: c-type cytochrome [Granulicella sp.]